MFPGLAPHPARAGSILRSMATHLGNPDGAELVVGDDGSIQAEQLRQLGLRPGARLRVVEAVGTGLSGSLWGSLPDLPDLSWEDFERGSDVARQDASGS